MIVVVGEALIDIVVDEAGRTSEEVGGAPLNVATTLARLETPAMLITQLGDDERGTRILEHLHHDGVEVVAAPAPGGRTSTATARLDAAGSAHYDFQIGWDLGGQELPHCDALYVGGLGTLLEPGRNSVLDLVDQAYQRDVAVCYDPNIRPAFIDSAEQLWRDVEAIAERSDIVKLSDLDIELLHPGADPAEVARSLLSGELTELVVLTRGADGASAYIRGGEASVPAPRVDVVDTVGAGDAFVGGMLSALFERQGLSRNGAGLPRDPASLTTLLQAAAQVAAITCSRRGAQPPTRPELPSRWPG